MTDASKHHYLIALGSNRMHHSLGGPHSVLRAALQALEEIGIDILKASNIITTAPLGPGGRRYANSAAIITTHMLPPALLKRLKQLERDFGRQERGGRWRARVLDIDIILWSGGIWVQNGPVIPHPAFHQRDFVLKPALEIAAKWHEPLRTLSLRHLYTRLKKPKPVSFMDSPLDHGRSRR